ncbi:hypothetical protein CHS0354_038757 [Potamilus streckersoni]|uniref:Uncharacterized protein n=1 Tax=Potamilus streckersoni TaxID=2493646 RepID=A0AAE0VZS7_9BIVA|nr:hypothetical protein CHS0354_038757 [Potamilus streckersoni]
MNRLFFAMAEDDRFTSTQRAHYRHPQSYGNQPHFRPQNPRESDSKEKYYHLSVTEERSRNRRESVGKETFHRSSVTEQDRSLNTRASEGKEKHYRSSLSEGNRSADTIHIPSGRSIINPSFERNPSRKYDVFCMTQENDGKVSETANEKGNPRSDKKMLGYQNRAETKDYYSRYSGAHQGDEPQRDLHQLEEQIRATIYGQCMGDAIGLLTEFMSKEEAREHYGMYGDLEFLYKIYDRHRDAWEIGDWTDDSDHMLLIMRSLTAKRGKVDANDFARRLYEWSNKGFPELHDKIGIGLGRTTRKVLSHPGFLSNPEMVSKDIWIKRERVDAPNGGVMRTSILGIHEWWDVEKVEKNAAAICRTTHFDPRCVASAVAVSVAISMMLKRQIPYYDARTNDYHVTAIIEDSYQRASKYLDKEDEKMELHSYMTCKVLAELKLDDVDKMGYTFKCLGAGFWALKQDRFRSAIQKLTMEGGDADTNCAVAGALLGCKLGVCQLLPSTWMSTLANKSWLQREIERYLELHRMMYRTFLRDGGGKPYNHSRY